MAKIPLHDLYKRALEAKGYREDLNGRSGRYTTMRHPDRKNAIFLGSAGAVRIGRVASATAAMPDSGKAALLGELAARMKAVIVGYEGNDPREDGDAPSR